MSSIYTPKYNYNFYLRNAYSKNREAINSDFRATQPNNTLVMADSDAMKKISEKLRKLTYDSDNGTEVLQTTKAFIETYNNLLETSGGSENGSIARLKKQFTNMTKEEKDALESIGIEVKGNGKLELDKEVFAKCKPSKIEKILATENTFTKSMKTYASRIYRISSQLVSAYDSNGEKKEDTNQSGSTVDVSL